jgi:hypothetical protein
LSLQEVGDLRGHAPPGFITAHVAFKELHKMDLGPAARAPVHAIAD